MSLPDIGFGSKTNHDQLGGTTYPRYMVMYAERKETSDSIPNDEDPIFGFRGATTHTTGTEGKVYMGILNGVLPTPEHNITVSNLNAGIVIETDRVTVKPGIVLDPTTEANAPDTLGSLMYDSGTDELKYYDGSWQIVSAGGLSSHALDGAYHTAAGLTVGWVLSADSATTFSWKAPTGGMSAHDMTGAYHTEDATGGAGNVIRATGATSFAWDTLAWGDLDLTSSSLADLATRTHASLSDAPADAHHVAFVLSDFTTAFAAESLANLTTRAHSDLSDAPTEAHQALVTVGGAPLTLSGQAVTFNYDSNHFKLTGNNLQVGTDTPSTDQVLTWSGSVVVWSDPVGSGVSGTQWTIPVFDTTTSIGDSMISQDSGGALATVNGDLYVTDQVGIGITAGTQPLKTYTATAADAIYLDSGGVWSGIASSTALYLKAASYVHLQSAATGQHMFFDCGGTFTFRDQDNGDATIFTIDSTTGDVQFDGILTIDTINAGTSDYNKFLVSDSGVVKFRTGTEAYSDMDGYVTADFTTDFAAESLANLTTRAHSNLSDAPADAHHVAFVLSDFTTAFAAESLANLATRTHASLSDAPADAHHVAFVLADFTTAFAAESLANLTTRAHSDLSDAPVDAHHAQSHILAGSNHTASGLTIGHVIAADSAPTFSWQAPADAPGTGTQYTLPRWATTTSLGDSNLVEDSGGTTLTGVYPTVSFDSGANTTNISYSLEGKQVTLVLNSDPAQGTDMNTAIDFKNAGVQQFRIQMGYPYSELKIIIPPFTNKEVLRIKPGSTAESYWLDNFILDGDFYLGADMTSPKLVNNADALELYSGSTPTLALTLQTDQDAIFAAAVTIGSIVAGTSDYDKFLVSDGGLVKFRTGTEVASDIGAATIPLSLTDLASYTQGSIIRGGAVDWEAYALGTTNHFLMAGATDVVWTQLTEDHISDLVHYTTSDFTTDFAAESLANLTTRAHANLSDAPTDAHHSESHALSGATHTATGLTVGHVIAADSATTFSWQAPTGGPGSGTQYTIPMWATTNTLGDSMISQDSGNGIIIIDGDLKVVDTEIYGNGTQLNLIANITTDGPRLILYDGTAAYQFFFNNVERAQLSSVGNFQHDGTLTVGTINAGVSDYNKFLVSDSGVVKFRTGTEVLADIGAVASGHDFDTHSGDVDLVDIASYVQGSIIIGGDTDWEALGAGTEDYVLKMGAAEPAWGQVDYSELSGDAGHWDTTDTEGVITAEIVDGQSIDVAIDSLIGTHTSDDNAHHEVIEAADVDAIITAELVDGQSIDLAIDALILTHKNLTAAHHAVYTNAMAVSAVEAANPLDLTYGLTVGGDIQVNGGDVNIGNSGSIPGYLSLGTGGVTNPQIKRDATAIITLQSGAAKIEGNLVMATGGIMYTHNLSPLTNDSDTVGTSTTDKYANMYASTFTTGDVVFANKFRITEVHHPEWDGVTKLTDEEQFAQSKEDGATPGLLFYNGKEEWIALLDEDGDFHIRGKLHECSSIFQRPD